MGDTQDLDQIEYRHHQTRDLSPVASSMFSQDSLRAWDSRIRPWVRHPHAGRLSESVCYQVLPGGHAALAWRYWDQRAAERADGTRGRPLVSRVLVGLVSVLSPEVAMALCRAGLTESVGPMPGEVPDGAELPTVSGDALNAVTRTMTPMLDRDAAQQAGLQAVVAAALADPVTPLAISIHDDLIQKPPRESVQCSLLWGLRRITGPLLGPVGRDWSFSTFELPLGETDPASLPGIVFRQAQDGVPPPPTRWRKEVKVRPLAPDALDQGCPYGGYVEFAGWLVAEYQARGGDGLEQFIAKFCGGERSLKVRLERVYYELRDNESPVVIAGEPAVFVPVVGGQAPALEKSESAESAAEEPEPEEPELDLPPPSPTSATRAPDGVALDGVHEEVSQLRQGRPQAAEPALGMTSPDERYQPLQEYTTMSQLLKQLELRASDAQQFDSVLLRIAEVYNQSDDPNDRLKSWEVIRNSDWYNNICRHRQFHPRELTWLFGIIVIPELAEPSAAETIARWAYHAPPDMVGGLLAAAKRSHVETWQAIMQVLEPVLAARWVAENLIKDLWDPGVAPSTAEPGGSDKGRSVFGRLRRR